MSGSRSRRRIRAALVVAAVLLISVPTAAILYIRSAAPLLEGSFVTAGLASEVEILRDSLGVPHIRAGTEADLYFAQGWVHAQDRLWQMEFFRRVGQGRLSEILGAGLVETDRFTRTIGLLRAARVQEDSLDESTNGLLSAYAAGVNAWIRMHDGALPPEFVVLRTEPEPWTPLHSLVIAKVMAFDLSLYSTAEQATRSAARLSEDRARLLVPDYPEWGSTILDSIAPAPVPIAAARAIEAVSITNASNAWVISGARTRSGSPILANDMHLALRAPSLWYLSALHAPGIDVAGMTLPGVPFVIAGHNRAIAWGFTNAMVDDADLFAERIDPDDPARYLTPWGSEPFEVIRDTVRVRGERPVEFEVRLTRHGPVIEGFEQAERGMVLSLRWAAHDPSGSIQGIRALNRAGDWHDFVAAVDLFEDPHQNVVYADTAGNIGYVMGGRVPIRGDGRKPPTLPVPGWTGEWDWNGWLPFERHPRALNPPRGFVVTANNRQAAGSVGDLIGTSFETPFRADRIRQMIEQSPIVDAAAVHAMQLDVQDALAARYRALATESARRAGRDRAAAVLEAWDLRADAESRGAALFYAWYEELRSRVASALYEGTPGWLPRGAFNAVLDSGALFWTGESGPSFDSLAVAAAAAADSVAGGRSWGELHGAHAEHPLSAVALVERLLSLDVGGGPAAGSPTTVNVSQYGGGGFPVDAQYGPSQRHVVDMANVDGTGGFIMPTGQSGLPFDGHYRDQWPLWQQGGLWPVPLDSTVARARSVHRLSLKPRMQ